MSGVGVKVGTVAKGRALVSRLRAPPPLTRAALPLRRPEARAVPDVPNVRPTHHV